MVGMTKDGLPRALGPMKGLIRSQDPRSIRLVLTLLTAGRAIRPTNLRLESLDSITAASTAKSSVLIDLQMFVTAFAMMTLKIKPIETDFKRLHFTEKAGPSGNAILTSLRDYQLLTPKMKSNLLLIGGVRLQDQFNDMDKMHPVAFNALSSY